MAKPKHRLRFTKSGRACYISHLDLMATFQRVFTRAEVPIWQTQGFNKHAYVSIAPVGGLFQRLRAVGVHIK